MAGVVKVYIGECKVEPDKKNRCVIIIIISIIIILIFNHLTKLRLAGMPRETTPQV